MLRDQRGSGSTPAATVGERPGKRAQKDDRKELGHRYDAEPGAGMGEGPGEPANRDALHPDADQRDGIAARVNAVVPVCEGLDDISQAGGEQPITENSQPKNSMSSLRAHTILHSAVIRPQSTTYWLILVGPAFSPFRPTDSRPHPPPPATPASGGQPPGGRHPLPQCGRGATQPARAGWVRVARTISTWLVVLTAAAAFAADPPVQFSPPAPPRDATTDAATYDHCMRLARQHPAEARGLAQAWHERGGAHPADHCAAVALIGLKQYKEAATRLEALAQAMTNAPASLRAEVLDQAGQAWGLAGDPVRAYAAAGAAVALAPNDPDLLIDRAQAAASAGYFDKTLADLDQVLKTSPNHVEALIYRASAYRARDRLDPALADIERALTLAPNSAPALLERGNIRRLQGDGDAARRDWERVGQLAPGSPADMAARANLERMERSKRQQPARSTNGR